jgi:hypothetical protein
MGNRNAVQFGKKSAAGFQNIAGPARHERIARSSLHDMIAFHDTLEQEMSRMMADHVEQGLPLENQLYERMVAVKETYIHVMRGLTEEDLAGQRLALIKFADTVQDLMSYIHNQRRH